MRHKKSVHEIVSGEKRSFNMEVKQIMQPLVAVMSFGEKNNSKEL